MKYKRNLGERYSPLFFLNACAAAAIALGFILYLTGLSAHNNPSLLSAMLLFQQLQNGSVLQLLAASLSIGGFLTFAYDFIQLGLWNKRHLALWQQTAAHTVFIKSTAAPMQVAPLVGYLCLYHLLYFAVALFVPFAFEYSDFLAPFGFAALGWASFHTGRLYLIHFIAPLRPPENQAPPHMALQSPHPVGLVLFVCAFALIGFGFANLALFSRTQFVPLIGFFAASLSVLIVLLVAFTQALPALRISLTSSAAPLPEKTLSLLLTACALTVTAAAIHHVRLCLVFSFSGAADIIGTFVFWTMALLLTIIASGLAFALYPSRAALQSTLTGPSFSVNAYGFVLVLMAFVATLFFLITDALVPMGLVEKNGLAFWTLLLFVFALHAGAISLFLKLNRKLFSVQQAPAKRR